MYDFTYKSDMVSSLGRLRQEACHEFEASLGYIVRDSHQEGKRDGKEGSRG